MYVPVYIYIMQLIIFFATLKLMKKNLCVNLKIYIEMCSFFPLNTFKYIVIPKFED